MKLKHLSKRAVKNSLFRIVNELDGKMYPLGLKRGSEVCRRSEYRTKPKVFESRNC